MVVHLGVGGDVAERVLGGQQVPPPVVAEFAPVAAGLDAGGDVADGIV